ncbi:MAG TPA: thiamine-phosphate kinase [Blastocatellia bacterium]|nr:thiamine-phosphate kinase [Blastocatellia bacterium]
MPDESEIISKIRRRARRTNSVIVGIGDDAAVLSTGDGKELVVCCDLMVEGVHFRRAWAPPKLIGRKSLAVSLSDIAAMGSVPRFATISVALPRDCSSEFIDELFEGICELADSCGVSLVGGDTSSSPDSLFIDSMVIGECERGKAITRSGARAGDMICVTGNLGASALGLMLLEQGARLGESEPSAETAERMDWQALMNHLAPVPRLQLGIGLAGRELATAMIDISDGLSTDLSHVLEESGVGAVIRADSIPIARCVESLAAGSSTIDSLHLALHGGEEYELLFTARPEAKAEIEKLASELGTPITTIGDVVTGAGIQLEREGTLERVVPAGFEHSIS